MCSVQMELVSEIEEISGLLALASFSFQSRKSLTSIFQCSRGIICHDYLQLQETEPDVPAWPIQAYMFLVQAEQPAFFLVSLHLPFLVSITELNDV